MEKDTNHKRRLIMSKKYSKKKGQNFKEKNNTSISQKYSSTKNYKSKSIEKIKTNYFLIPVFIVLCIIPLIVRLKIYNPHLSRYSWYPNSNTNYDFFLYQRQWAFIAISVIMAAIVIINCYYKRKSVSFPFLFIPLAVYALLALFSSLFSKYTYFCFNGSFEEFESILALLGYFITTYYVYLFIKSERDIKIILKFLLFMALLFSLLGIFQFLGYDFFSSKLGYNLIVPEQYRKMYKLTFNFGKNLTYLTLYNPDYVGLYIAMIIPILSIMLFFQKKLLNFIIYAVSITGLLICLIGSHTLAGVIGLGVAVICILIFMRKYYIKHLYITIPVIVFAVISVVIVNIKTDNMFTNKVYHILNPQKAEYLLSDIHTENNDVGLTYKGNNLKVKYIKDTSQSVSLELTDQNNKSVSTVYDATSNTFTISDKRFSGITLGLDQQVTGAFYIKADNVQYCFSNQTGNGKYYFINRYGRYDKLITTNSSILKGYETFASGRGYIWSRTIPLLKNYIILGSGPNTFTMVFPQQDYMNMTRYGFGQALMTKPHSIYLQTAVQTGFLSLIAFLVFYGMYFVSSIRLYIKGCFESYYAKAGLGIFIGTFAYMVTGLTNDSSITVAPVFWALIGVGIAANIKAKPLIMEEMKEIKAKEAAGKEAE